VDNVTDLRWIVAILLVAVGAAGVVLPALPGAPLVFAGLLLAAWIEDFQKVGWLPLSILALLAVGIVVVDVVASALGAKRVRASGLAVAGALVGTVVGLFFGIPGLILGPFVGAVLGEYAARRDLRQAGKVGLGTWLGLLLGTAAKLALVFVMLAVFVAAYAW
jgi:uncharacterized protein